MKRSQLRALAVRFVTSWANPPVTPEDHKLRGLLNWFAGYESCSRRHRHDRAKWRLLLTSANAEIRRLQLENLALRLDGLEYPGRPMVMGDLCDWSFHPSAREPYPDRYWASASDLAVRLQHRPSRVWSSGSVGPRSGPGHPAHNDVMEVTAGLEDALRRAAQRGQLR